MKFRIFCVLLFQLAAMCTFSQKQTISKDELEFFKKMSFQMGINFFNDDAPLTEDIDTTATLPWSVSKPADELLPNILRSALENAEFSVTENFGQGGLVLKISLQANTETSFKYGEDFSIKVIDSELVDELGEMVTISDTEAFVLSNSSSSMTTGAGTEYLSEYRLQFELARIPTEVAGSVLLQYSQPNGYDYKLFTPSDVDEVFTWGNSSYKLLNMHEGKAILKNLTAEHAQAPAEFSYICTNSDGLIYQESADSGVDFQFGKGNSRLDFNQIMYEFFSEREHPSVNEYSKYVDERVEQIPNQTFQYVGISCIGEIERLYLYKQNFTVIGEIKKEIGL